MNLDALYQERDLPQEALLKNTIERAQQITLDVEKELIPENFDLDDEGVWYLENAKSPDRPPVRNFIAAPLRVAAYTRDQVNENHGRILEFKDIDNHQHILAMPMDLLAGDGSKVIGMLLNKGLQIDPVRKSKDRLLEYITRCQPLQRARCVLQTGWHEGLYVLPDETIGKIVKEKIIFQGSGIHHCFSAPKGTLEDWKNHISVKARDNSRLILGISAAFAGPMLKIFNHENIGIHFRGNSSLGKSTAGFVANSVWAKKEAIHSLRATSNGLEGIAVQFNDGFLCLDELGQLSPHVAGEVFYMIGNGQGKSRANKEGLLKPPMRWSLVFISNGELSLEQLLLEANKRLKAGQEVRLIDVPADAGKYGLFEELHGLEDGSAMSDYFRDACNQYYGTAGRAFLRHLVQDEGEAKQLMMTIIEGIRGRYLPKEASGQVIRVFNHFALIAATGELASSFGVTGWEVGEAEKGVMKCFLDWLELRGDGGAYEEKEALSAAKSFFQLHGETRFSDWYADPINESRTFKRVGFKKRTQDESVEFFMYRKSFRDEVCAGLDFRLVERVCIKHNLLLPASDGAPTRSERLPGSSSTTRCYRFKSEVLSE